MTSSQRVWQSAVVMSSTDIQSVPVQKADDKSFVFADPE